MCNQQLLLNRRYTISARSSDGIQAATNRVIKYSLRTAYIHSSIARVLLFFIHYYIVLQQLLHLKIVVMVILAIILAVVLKKACAPEKTLCFVCSTLIELFKIDRAYFELFKIDRACYFKYYHVITLSREAINAK